MENLESSSLKRKQSPINLEINDSVKRKVYYDDVVSNQEVLETNDNEKENVVIQIADEESKKSENIEEIKESTPIDVTSLTENAKIRDPSDEADCKDTNASKDTLSENNKSADTVEEIKAQGSQSENDNKINEDPGEISKVNIPEAINNE